MTAAPWIKPSDSQAAVRQRGGSCAGDASGGAAAADRCGAFYSLSLSAVLSRPETLGPRRT
jgi:hypothetical protein